MSLESPFKAYDIRGRIDENLDEELAYALGRAVGEELEPACVATGRDIRSSSVQLQDALISGLNEGGCDVVDIGLCGTEEVYFATDHLNAGAGIMVTASHNPIDYNGMKLVGQGARPLSDEVFRRLEARALTPNFGVKATSRGKRKTQNLRPAYVERVASFVKPDSLPEITILANAGNGCAGPAFDDILGELIAAGAPLKARRLHHIPDGTFPNGIPNPLLPENQPVTAQAVCSASAGIGLAWDGDFDRCFFFDEEGQFVPGEYMVGLIAQTLIAQNPGTRIVHDPRVQWNTQSVVAMAGGEAIVSRTGHARIKSTMRSSDAIYGGEMSAHHYFREFMYCDSGQIPWLLILDAMRRTGKNLSELVAKMRENFPSSGEINFKVENTNRVIDDIRKKYRDDAEKIDTFDGISMEWRKWRFNLRASQTEPLLRLNVETRGDSNLLSDKVGELTKIIERFQ